MKRFLNGFAQFLGSPLLVWIAWLGILLWSWLQLWRGETHPSWWPIVALVLLLIVGTVALFSQVVVAFAKRDGRVRALQAFLLGTVPLWLIGAHIAHVYITTLNRLVKIEPLTITLIPISCVVAEIEATLRYPHKTEGDRVVMFHHGTKAAAEQVAEADRFLADLEALMKRPFRTKIFWVRGPLLGRDHYSFAAMAMGSSSESDEFTGLDRHELAHAAINQHFTVSTRTPMILVEGWAEACANGDSERLWSTAGEEREWALPLRELAAPPWAWIDLGPVYTQGGAFVRMLLDDYGYEKFIRLYLECRPDRFEADCARILGESLWEIQQRYDARLSEWSETRRVRGVLESIEIGEGIDLGDWKRFIDDYVAGVERDDLGESYEVRLTTNWKSFPSEDEPEAQSTSEAVRVVVTEDLRAAIYDDMALMISPGDAFRLSRETREQPWSFGGENELFPDLHRWNLRSLFASSWSVPFRDSFGRHKTWNWREHPPTLIEFRRTQEAEGELVRIKLDRPPGELPWDPVSEEATFASRVNWRVIERRERLRHSKEFVSRTNYDYRYDEERLRSLDRKTKWSDPEGNPHSEGASSFLFDHAPNIDPNDFTRHAFGVASDAPRETPPLDPIVLVCLILAGVQLCVGVIPTRRGVSPS